MTDSGPEQALQLAVQALAGGPSGILTDLDGTLAPIAAMPDAVHPVPAGLAALADLADRLAVVGVVTGRAAADARGILGPVGQRLLVIGNHGLERLAPGAAAPELTPALDAARRTVRTALETLDDALGEGVRVEDKGISATIHFRGAPDPAAAGRAIRAALGPVLGGGLELRRGRMSLELRPVGLGDKGSALRAEVARHGLRGLLVAGDDVTDLDMFGAARTMRENGELQVAVIGVGGGHEVPAEVAAAADVVLASPREMANLLASLARALSASP
jgi:trehalose 6-phosphate phosphatase